MTDKRANSTTARIAIALYCLVGGGFLLQGARYLSADVLMEYHLAVLGAPWLTPITAGVYAGLLYNVTSSALLPGARPIAITAVLFGLVCLAVLCAWLDRAQETHSPNFFMLDANPYCASSVRMGKANGAEF